MKENSLLNKPIVLSLLFMLVLFAISFGFDGMLHLLKVDSNIAIIPITWTISAIIFGIIYTKINKELFSQKQKIKIALYSVSILLFLFLAIMTFLLDFINATPFHLVVGLLSMILPTLLIIVSGACIYPALDLGCSIANDNKSENTLKLCINNCLVIALLFVLGIGLYKFNDVVLNAIKPHVLAFMENKGYIKKIKPFKIEVKRFKDKTSISGLDFITTTNYANPKLSYYYYIPKKIKKSKTKQFPFLIVTPSTIESGQEAVTQQFKDFAQQSGFVIIAPSFVEDSKNLDSETSYEYPAAWAGKAFNNVIADFSAKQHIYSKGLYFFGMSTGAQFAERYSLLYPNSVIACFLCAPDNVSLPKSKQKTKFIITVGNKDTPKRRSNAFHFYESAKAIGIDIKYKEYDIGHGLSPEQIRDSILFFEHMRKN